jgi:hypothetical protein
MTVRIDERQYLIDAMRQLTFGDSRKFCDLLWLGFGDSWRPTLAELAARQLVTVRPSNEGEIIEITPRGRAWTQQAGTLAAAAAA